MAPPAGQNGAGEPDHGGCGRFRPSLSPHEVKLAEAAIDSMFASGAPKKLAGGKAYDRDGLDEIFMKKQWVEMIAPYRANRKIPRGPGRAEAQAA